MRIAELFSNEDTLLTLEPEELAGIVLQHLASLTDSSSSDLNRYNFTLPSSVARWAPSRSEEVARALTEAWIWLEREGLIAPRPGTQNDWFFVTRRGQRLAEAGNFSAYRKANLLPRGLLHPTIAQKVWATFLRGDYDTAVFQAFKEVEVQVRRAASFQAELLGTDLMRKAFDSNSGPLADPNQLKAEREALSHLFAGAIGSYKNPHSHRSIQIDAEEAVEIIMLASHLLKIVDARSQKGAASSG